MKFYLCKKCKKMVEMIKGSPCPTMCCGEAMEELTPNTTDAAQEKHVPAPGGKPSAVVVLAQGDEPAAAYEYCNLHGLWKAEI